jgi:hypothetical protein
MLKRNDLMAKQQGLAPKALKHYGDKLRYFFALSGNALPLQKKVIISYICHSVVCTIGNRFSHLCQVPTDSFPVVGKVTGTPLHSYITSYFL